MTQPVPADVMPDFCSPRRGVRHTLRSAYTSLRALGIDEAQIRFVRVGSGWTPGAVVRQVPAPGEPLQGMTQVILEVSAPSALHALPYAMRDTDEGTVSAEQLMAVLDGPIARAQAFVDDAGGFLDLTPARPETGWRWIREIFALELDLPDALTYRMARLLPALAQFAGTERGLALGLQQVLELPLHSLVLRPVIAPLAAPHRTRLGTRNGRLGVDAAIGDGLGVHAQAVVTIGAVDLDVYLAQRDTRMRGVREILYSLLLPATTVHPVVEQWRVHPPPSGARLLPDHAAAPAPRLGLTSILSAPTTHHESTHA